MKKKLVYGTLLAALGVNLLFGAQIYFRSVSAAEKDDAYPNLKLFSLVLEHVRRDYVDADKVRYEDLIQGALRGMLNTLDPHSEFMEPSKFTELKNDTQGEYGGLGIVISIKDDWLTVVAPMEDSPSFKAGILPDDRIIKIDGRSTERMSTQDAMKRLRGAPGSEVTLTILRLSSGQTLDFKLKRAVIKLDSVKDINGRGQFPVDENKIGYVRVTQFGENTVEELDHALQMLKKNGMRSLIMDLRGNPGGLLDTAAQTVELFVPRGTLIVTTEGRTLKSEYKARGGDKYNGLSMVVLVNGGSASASEIVSGALQDLTKRGIAKAVILGEQTFGKGSVQSVVPLQGGAALRLTTAKYYTPSHKVIHERGITPDIIVPMSEEQERDMNLRRMPGGIESLPTTDRERVKNSGDPQLDRAIDLLKGLAAYTQMQPATEPVEKIASK